MEGDAPQVPEVSVTQEAQPEVKEVPQTPQQPPVVPQTPPPPAGGPTPPTKPKKRLRIILIILIALVVLGIGGFLIWKYFSTSNISFPGTQKADEEVYIYKGMWIPSIYEGWLASNIQKMKDMGMNTVSLSVGFLIEDDGQIGVYTSHTVEDIQVAHENDMKVMLNPNFYPQPKLEDLDVEELNSKIIEVAKLAEENDVELFAPLGEPGVIFHPNTGKWRQEILPKIKKVYHGEIFWSGAGIGLPDRELSEEYLKELSEQPPGDFSGYDYRGISLLILPQGWGEEGEGMTLEEYSRYVDNVLKYVSALAEKDNCKVMITEFDVLHRFFMAEPGVVVDRLEDGSWSKEEFAKAYEIVLEKGEGKVAGFIAGNFLEIEMSGVLININDTPKTKEVVKKWFTEIL